MPSVLITKPEVEPLTLGEVKTHVNELTSDFDGYLSSLIFVARKHVEDYLNRALITQTWDYYQTGFSDVIWLPKGKLQSVTTIKYIDTDGALQILAGSPIEYSVDTYADPGKVERAYGQAWPGVRPVSNSVVVRFIAGYGDSGEDVEEPIRQAMLILIGHWFQHRELTDVGNLLAEVPLSTEALLFPYMILTG